MKGRKIVIPLLTLLVLLPGAHTPAQACLILEPYESSGAVEVRGGGMIDVNHKQNRAPAMGKVEHDWFINIATGNVGPNMVVAGKDNKSGNTNGRAGFVSFGSVMQFPDGGSAGSNPVLLGKRIRGASVFNFWLYNGDPLSEMSAAQVVTSELLTSTETAVPPDPAIVWSEAFIAGDTGIQVTSAALSLAPPQSPLDQTSVQYVTSSAENEAPAKVPEPATLILYGLGFAGAGLYMHWRRSRN